MVITEHLSGLCFDQARSLFEEEEEYYIKTYLSRGLFLNRRYTLEDIPRRPFKSESEYYMAQISVIVKHVKYLHLGHHCFFTPITAPSENSDYAGMPQALAKNFHLRTPPVDTGLSSLAIW